MGPGKIQGGTKNSLYNTSIKLVFFKFLKNKK